MIDIHCHILPGVDDGSESWEMTIQMCRIAYSDGIRHIVATPHCNYSYPYERERHVESLDQLRQKVPELKFSLGCDLHLSHENIEAAIRYPESYVIEGTPYLLVELSDFATPHQMTESLFRLHSAGLRTIVSHPERNPIVTQYSNLPAQFVAMGANLQLTAGALCGMWGRKTTRICEALMRRGLVSFISTDAHDSNVESRYSQPPARLRPRSSVPRQLTL